MYRGAPGTGARAACYAVLLLSVGCIRWNPDPLPAPRLPPVEQLKAQQIMFTLAYLSYAGEKLDGKDPIVALALKSCIEEQLEHQTLLGKQWQLVWGPGVYRLLRGALDDNMMYVAADKTDPARLVIAIRGTNGSAVLDWIVEDFEVFRTVPWSEVRKLGGAGPETSAPQAAAISHGTYEGLEIVLEKLAVAPDESGQSKSIAAFLADYSTRHRKPLTVSVAGHSLGGALAPALALWLHDNRSVWDHSGRSTIDVYTFAGPTAGNAAFADYYDSGLGRATQRVYTNYDIVPKAWTVGTLEQIPALYEPVIPARSVEKLPLELVIDLVADKHYGQIKREQPPLPGAVNAGLDSLANQVEWQHTCGYLCALDIAGDFKPVSPKCGAPPDDVCGACPVSP